MKDRKWIPYPRYIFRKELALSLVKKYVPSRSRFLEIGCASGDFGITLAKRGYTGVMLDFSSEAADQVLRNLEDREVTNVRFENCDLFEIGTEEKFELVTMFEVLEHVERQEEAFKKANDLLNEGGMFLFSVPSKAKLWGASDVLVGHIRRYEKKQLICLLEGSGFRVVRLLSYGFPWLNVIKYFRDRMARKKLRSQERSSRVSLTQKSGLNVIVLKTPLFRFFSNKYFLFLPIHISRLFNRFDLAEGYLCLARKK